MKSIEPISEPELMKIQLSRYRASFWVSPEGKVSQVPKNSDNNYPAIENLKSLGYKISQSHK